MIRRDLLNRAIIETLEGRRLFAAELAGGVLTVTGTDADDKIVLNYEGATSILTVTDNGTVSTFDTAITSVQLLGLAGNVQLGIEIDHEVKGRVADGVRHGLEVARLKLLP